MARARNARSPAPTMIPSRAKATDPMGCIAPTHSSDVVTTGMMSASLVKRCAIGDLRIDGQQPEGQADEEAPAEDATGGATGVDAVIGTQGPSDEALRRRLEGVGHVGHQRPPLHRDLVAGEGDRAPPRRQRGRQGQRGPQRDRADEQVPSDHGVMTDPVPPRSRPSRPRRPSRTYWCASRDTHTTYDDGSAPLCDHRSGRRPGEAPPRPEHQDQLEHDVQGVGHDRDDEGRAGVEVAPECPGSRHRDAERRETDQRDAQVDEGFVDDVGPGPEQVHERIAQHGQNDRQADAEQQAEPQALHRVDRGVVVPAGAEQSGHGRRRCRR